ncbi:flippase-like domain-containing protein [Geomonas sp. Red32]|uniref:flippase-like domain-containing protein n=1 Tax=Geomonas sp. Red32 TaxID=2912856 RepID=UPI00202CE9B9|nr:flippase-like domain-containing protein [Geomonas sp. Red32]MCM0081415.1 flippase-like domain-containing protein [Geomonas sp. Red32]
MRRLNLALLAIAAVALAVLLRGLDWPALAVTLAKAKHRWPLLLIPYALTTFLWTLSWRLLLPGAPGRVSLWRLYLLRLAGESLNQLTPTASLGGEPFKTVRLQAAGVPWQQAATSVIIHKAAMVLSLVLYLLIGLAMLPAVLPEVPSRLAWSGWLGTGVLALAGGSFLVVQRASPCTSLLRILKRFGICPGFLRRREEALASLDATLAAFYRRHPWLALGSLLMFLLGWAAHAAEVYVIFAALGHGIGLGTALCLDALSQMVAALGFMIPASLGVQDGGNLLLALGFRLGATLGAGFGLLRRFREAFWLLLGLLAVTAER